jgi:ubiquinone/menaquinone biosynthesis C-methylase UbiE
MYVNLTDWSKENSIDSKASSGRLPSYPLEYLVRLFSSSNYSAIGKEKEKAPLDFFLNNGMPTVVDVGSGFCNHTRFFLENGYRAICIDVTEDMCNISKNALKRFGFPDAEVYLGDCEHLPVNDQSADVLLAMRSIHYARGRNGMHNALKEIQRVTKKDGLIFIQTIGDGDSLREGSERVGEFEYCVKDYAFRSGKLMALFDSLEHFEGVLGQYFPRVEVGRLVEEYPGNAQKFSHFIGFCQA